MSLDWKEAARHSHSGFKIVGMDKPWDDDNGEGMHDGVEAYGGISVAHPDDTPYHNEDLMQTKRVSHGRMNPHGDDFHGIQAWLDEDTLNHFVDHPHEIEKVSEHDPISMLHDEDTGDKYLVNGHHRVVAARYLGKPDSLPARITSVSRARL